MILLFYCIPLVYENKTYIYYSTITMCDPMVKFEIPGWCIEHVDVIDDGSSHMTMS